MQSETTPSPRSDRFDPRPCQVSLRDGRIVNGIVSVPEGQTLIRFLWQRTGFLNLTSVSADWLSDPPLEHLAVRLTQIAWVGSADGQIPLKPTAAMPLAMPVEVRLESGAVLDGHVDIAFNERLSDLLDTEGPFLPLFRATERGGRRLGDIALNVDCVVAVRGLPDADTGSNAEDDAAF